VRTSSGRRRRLEPAAARELVLTAAEELLKSAGPSALRLGEIAKRAGLSHSNVLYHFDGVTEVETKLGERIAIRLMQEIAEIHLSNATNDVPIESANERLFSVLSDGNNARLLWWAIFVSERTDEPKVVGEHLRGLADLIASNPVVRSCATDDLKADVVRGMQLAICAALGFGLLRGWMGDMFGIEFDASKMSELLSEQVRARLDLHKVQS